MSEITITALRNAGGPEIPSEHSAYLAEKEWPGSGTIPVLKLGIGDCQMTIWPADPDAIIDLGKKLINIGRKLHPVFPIDTTVSKERWIELFTVEGQDEESRTILQAELCELDTILAYMDKLSNENPNEKYHLDIWENPNNGYAPKPIAGINIYSDEEPKKKGEEN